MSSLITRRTPAQSNVAFRFVERLRERQRQTVISNADGSGASNVDLIRMVVGLAENLSHMGVGPGHRVLLQIPNGELLISGILASIYAGATPVVIDPRIGPAAYLDAVKLAGPSLNLVHPLVLNANRFRLLQSFSSRYAQMIPPVPDLSMPRFVLDIHRLRAFSRSSTNFGACPASPGDDAIIVFTGGTTGTPKGVRFSHAAVEAQLGNLELIAQRLPKIECMMALTPQQAIAAIWLGMRVTIARGSTSRLAGNLLTAIVNGQANAYYGAPFIWSLLIRRLASRGQRLPSSLKAILLGGAPVTVPFLESLRRVVHPATRVLCLYGMTEAGPVTAASLEDKLSWHGPGDFAGEALGEFELDVDSCSEEGIGEVNLRGPALFTGYLGSGLTNCSSGFPTGDLGTIRRKNSRKQLILMGRQKDLVVRKGFNVYPGMVEPAVLGLRNSRGMPIAKECGIVGLWDTEQNDERLILFYVPAPGAGRTSEQEMMRYIRRTLGPSNTPDHVFEVNELPTAGRQNKVDKNELRQIAQTALLRAGIPVKPLSDGDGERQ